MMRSVRMPTIDLLPAEVIEAFAEGLNATKAFLGGWPELRIPSSETSNVVVLMAEEDSLDRDLIVRGAAETTLTIDGNRRRYGGVIFCFEVRRRRERSRTRRQPLTSRDRSRGNGLVDHAWIAHPDRRAWREELRKMLASGQKCELEAVCVKPRGGSDFGRLSKFVKDAILNEDWLG